MDTSDSGLYVLLISVHGLIRGDRLELGRDADTGGQTKYVVELARALSERPDVAKVDLVTRRIHDENVSDDYARAEEPLSPKARIVRFECGPDRYLRKEELWDHLDSFADNLLLWLRRDGRMPSLVHGHYADGAYVGVRVAHQLGLPFAYTGHSLGRVKRRRLLAAGLDRDEIESHYHMTRRIEAEENALANAALVVVSSRQEIDEQYDLYHYQQRDRMVVVPPGIDLDRFRPPDGRPEGSGIREDLGRFLRDPERPMILALSRPDERKNLERLVEAYGSSPELRDTANLVVVAGTRTSIRDMEQVPRRVMTGLLFLIDEHDLYGQVAYPKHHQPEDVPALYRLVARSGGVFVNAALTEPFGLTLIEAAASGLPIVATEDGGPQEIVENCGNGILVDPLDTEAIRDALLRLLGDRSSWETMAARGLDGVKAHYSWESHASSYVKRVRPLLEEYRPLEPAASLEPTPVGRDRAVFTDLDQNLLGDPSTIAEFLEYVRPNRHKAAFGIATGRSLESALAALRRYRIPLPDVLITGAGTAIHYAPRLTVDHAWSLHIDHLWNPRSVYRLLNGVPGLTVQPRESRSRFKISYDVDPENGPTLEEIHRILLEGEQTVNAILSFGRHLDVLPVRASKGFALRHVAHRWGVPLDRIVACGGSGADEDMMRGNTLAAVVKNRHEEELSQLVELERIYFAKSAHARGIVEAMKHYDLYGACRPPIECPS